MSGSNLIQVTAETLQSAHTALLNNSNQISSMLSHLQTQVAGLQDSFKGYAADQYQQYWNEWHTSATNLNQALNGLANLTQQVLNSFQDQDQQLGNLFRN